MSIMNRYQNINNTDSSKSVNTEKVGPYSKKLLNWFSKVIKEKIAKVEENNIKTGQLKIMTLTMKNNRSDLSQQIKEVQFDTLRQISEIMYIVNEYLPEVYNINRKLIKFVKVVYERIQTLYYDFYNSKIKPKTEEEKMVVKNFIYSMEEVEKMVIPLIEESEALPLKRIRKIVDYTGMDMIDPESEYDGFTVILADETKYTDSDYEPSVSSEDEEDEEEEDEEEDEEDEDEDEAEDYVPDEDEDYVPDEDEEDEDELEEDKKEEIRLLEILQQSKINKY